MHFLFLEYSVGYREENVKLTPEVLFDRGIVKFSSTFCRFEQRSGMFSLALLIGPAEVPHLSGPKNSLSN